MFSRSTIPPRWISWAALAAITALAAFLRFWQLDTIPPGFHFDEAYEALEAWRVLTQPGYHPIFFPGNFGVEPMFIYLTSVAFRFFGETPTVMRSVAALVGTLTVPALYGLGMELVKIEARVPKATPLLAALALAIMRWHLLFSRVGIEPILIPLFLTLILWVFWRAMRTNGWLAWLVLGVATGLSPYTYPAGRLLPFVPVTLVAIHWLAARDRLKGRWRGLFLAGTVAALVFVPLGLNFLQYPDQLLLRSSQIVVDAEAAATPGIWQNLLSALGMFSFRGDLDPRSNIPGLPALDPLISIPFFLGLGAAIWRWKRVAFGALLASGLLMLAPTILSEYAPHFRRAIGATPVTALLIGVGLAMILGQWRDVPTRPEDVPERLTRDAGSPERAAAQMDRLRKLGRIVIAAALVLGSAIFGGIAYFGRWAHSSDLYYAYDEGLWEIGQYVQGLPEDEIVYVTPRLGDHTTLAFAWRAGRTVRHFDGRHTFVAPAFAPVAGHPVTYIVIQQEDFRGLRLLQDIYSGAVVAHTFLDRTGDVYALALHVPDSGAIGREPKTPVSVSWPGIDLIGYDLDRPSYQPGDIVYLQLWWRAKGAVANDWTVFTHLLGPPKSDGNLVWAGQDARPGQGSAPTSQWQAGELILDEYQLTLPKNIPSGEYQIEVGLYSLAAGGARALMEQPPGQDHVFLGSVGVE